MIRLMNSQFRYNTKCPKFYLKCRASGLDVIIQKAAIFVRGKKVRGLE